VCVLCAGDLLLCVPPGHYHSALHLSWPGKEENDPIFLFQVRHFGKIDMNGKLDLNSVRLTEQLLSIQESARPTQTST
jgi:hypothetical protein